MTTTGIYTYDGNFAGNLRLVYSKPTDSIGYFNNSTPQTSSTGTGLVYGAIAVSSGGNNMITTLYGGNVLTSTDAGVTWTFRTAPGSRLWRTAAISDNGSVMVVGSEDGYVWTSTNSGVTWTNPTNVTQVYASVISPDGRTIAFGGPNGEYSLFISTNSGATFTNPRIQGSGGPVVGIAIVWNTPSIIVVTTSGWMWRSVNSGGSWTNIVENTGWGNIVTTADGAIMAVAHPTDIRVSTDFGVTWTSKLSSQNSWKDVKVSSDGQKMVALSGAGHIWISTNAGTNWTQQSTSGGPGGSYSWYNAGVSSDLSTIVCLVWTSTGGNNIYSLWKTTNLGTTWTRFEVTLGGGYIRNMAASYDLKYVIMAVNGDYVYTSTNSGTTYTRQTSMGIGNWCSVATSQDGTVLAAVNINSSIWVSTNSGGTWQQTAGGQIYICCVSSTGQPMYYIFNTGQIYKSTDRGSTWTMMSNSPFVYWQSLSISSNGNILLGGSRGSSIYFSTDAGNTWTTVTGVTTGSRVRSTYMSSSGVYMIVGSDSGTWLSTNTGSTWKQLTNMPGHRSAISDNGQVIINVSYNGTVLISIDGGNTIRNTLTTSIQQYFLTTQTDEGGMNISSDGTNFICVARFNGYGDNAGALPGFIWRNNQYIIPKDIGGYLQSYTTGTQITSGINVKGPYKSTNSVTTRSLNVTGQFFQCCINASGSQIMVANAVGYIYISRNSGKTWTSLTTGPTGINKLSNSYDGSVIVATSSGSFSISTNAANTWTTITAITGSWAGVDVSSDGSKIVICGTNTPIYISTDTGVTWISNTNMNKIWSSIVISKNGQYIAASASSPSATYVSSNFDGTWTLSYAAVGELAISQDGSIILGAIYRTGTYVSTNFGGTWTASGNGGTRATMSYNGKVLITGDIASDVKGIRASTNYGNTWELVNTNYGGGNMQGMKSNEDASIIVNGGFNDYVYLLKQKNVDIGTIFNPYTSGSQRSIGLVGTKTPAGVIWTQPSSNPALWTHISSSDDGTKLAAANYSSPNIALSTNSGVTWSYIRPNASFTVGWQVASSSDGSILLAGDNNITNGSTSYIYTSTNSGANWTQRNSVGSAYWYCMGMSSNGQIMVAIPSSGGSVIISTNTGNTWSPIPIAFDGWYRSLTVSSSGTTIITADNNNSTGIFISTNMGVTWTQRTIDGGNWYVTASSDGQKIAACKINGYIYTSIDRGVSWTQRTSSTIKNWSWITSSADGTKLAAVIKNGNIFLSRDSGETWSESTSTGSNDWYGIASSANGSKLAAVASNTSIFTSSSVLSDVGNMLQNV